jgi:hypothetical protein
VSGGWTMERGHSRRASTRGRHGGNRHEAAQAEHPLWAAWPHLVGVPADCVHLGCCSLQAGARWHSVDGKISLIPVSHGLGRVAAHELHYQTSELLT